jgi:D-alanyl-D-alanine carboxypeptidase/D-alanyl-D-alanine-endopeptidase (penicillin-binding protein 4)
MTKTLRTFALLACALAACGAELPEKIQAAIDASPVARNAFWGIRIVDLDSGAVLYDLNAGRFFVPASNTKLFTTALGLMRLGPDYRYRTTVLAGRAPDAAGAVPDLRLVGGGDPNLSARAIPYRTGPITGDPLAAVEDLADQLVARGVRRVNGGIIGDDTAYVWAPFPDGWSIDDPLWEYGAPVSALTLNDNAFTLSVRPGERAGDLARVALEPGLEFYRIDNRVRTVAAGGPRRLQIDREPGSRQLRLWGTLPLGDEGRTTLLGIDDPAAYAASALARALARRGVAISGGVRAEHLFPNQIEDLAKGPVPAPPAGIELARRESAPLFEDLRITAKVSQNLHAELTLRAVARARRGIGSREAGLEEMRTFLDEAGIDRAAYNFADGSGLARLNLVTPAAVVQLLRYMWASPARENWSAILPVAAGDGTLANRFSGTAAAGRIRAKTGSLSHVSALSGYAARAGGGRLAFAILVNNYNGSTAEVRGAMDKICSLIVE